jgi:hypothetical protein
MKEEKGNEKERGNGKKMKERRMERDEKVEKMKEKKTNEQERGIRIHMEEENHAACIGC